MKQIGYPKNDWAFNNPILPERTLGIETDTSKIKVGDGALTARLFDWKSDERRTS